MRRRAFIAGLLTWEIAKARAQAPGRIYRLGVLGPGDASSWLVSPMRTITLATLAEYGFADHNLQVQVHFDSGESLAELARELVTTQPDVIVAISRSAILAARRATSTIPIVMSFIGEDPVAAGLAANITRPGRNVTGLLMLAPELDAKRLELLREAIPDAQRIAVLISNRAEEDQKKATMETIAGRLGAELRFFPVSGPNDYGAAFKSMGAWRAQALAVGSAPELFRDATEIARMAIDERLPTVCEWREMASAGCLLGYGPNLVELRHRMADYVVRILNGAAPGDLPIEGPTRFEFAVTLGPPRRSVSFCCPPSCCALTR